MTETVRGDARPWFARHGSASVVARYAVLSAVGGVLAGYIVIQDGPHPFNDWISFESAARFIIHYHHATAYEGDALRVYALIPGIQIGPPAILPVAAMQGFSPYTVSKVFVAVMVVLGVAAIAAAELAARRVGARSRRRLGATTLVGGGIVIVDWAWCVARWHHLDDAMALSFTAIACWFIARGKPWWLIGLLIGTAVAAKPWALVLTPVLLGLDRSVRSKAILATIVTAGAWWAPFVVGGPGTVTALGQYPITSLNGSVLSLFGIHGHVQHWLRPVQFIGGMTAGVLVACRGGRAWLAAPLAGLAIRVLTDPFPWQYYGMGPILFALVWDLARPSGARFYSLPIYTIVTAAVEGLVLRIAVYGISGPASPTAIWVASMKLAWGVGVLVALALEVRRSGREVPAALRPQAAAA